MSVFDVLNTGTVSIVRNNATRDGAGGAIANYEVVEADLTAQVDYHRDKLFGAEVDAYGQLVNVAQRDVWLAGTFAYLGDTGNGYAVRFEDDSFGRITAVERDQALGALPASVCLVVKVMGVQHAA